MPRRKMPANGKAERGSTSLLYDSNNNTITDHNNNHLTNYNQDNSESNEQLSHSNTSSPNIKKELSDYNDLVDDQNSSQGNDEELNEDEQLNDELELDDDNMNNQLNSGNNKTGSRSILSCKLTNGALQSSPLSLFANDLEKQTKLLNHFNSLAKGESLIKNSNKSDGSSILESLNLTGLNSWNNLNNLNSQLNQLNQLSNLNNSNNLSSLTNLNNQLNNLNSLSGLNSLGLNHQSTDDNYGVLMNANDDDDEDSSNMVITPDIGDYASYNDDEIDEQINLKQNLNAMDDDEELDNDLMNDNSKDDREGCRSLICDSNGIIIAEMVYRCMVCSNISDSITDAQRHYQLKHIFNQSLGLNSNNNSPLNNYNWKSNSANSSRSSNSSNNLVQQMKNKELQRKKVQRIQQQRIQQLQRVQQQQAKLKEQKLKQHNKQQRQLQLQQQQQLQSQLQMQQNQRLEQIRQQQLNDQIQQLHQQQSNSDSPQQISTVSNSVPDLNSLFLNPPLPGTVAKTPQSSHGSSRGGYVTCAVCSITKFYASVQRRYGQFTCMGCAKFFGRFLAKPKKFNCPNLGSCALNTSPRCKACLLLACINTYTIDEKRKLVVNANRPVQRPGPSLIGRASDSSVKRKSAKVAS